jgi:hypothetical protein
VEPRGSAVKYSGNPRFRPNFAFKTAETTEDMNQRSRMLVEHAVVITEEGPRGAQSREEVKDIIFHTFGIRKHGFFVYRS